MMFAQVSLLNVLVFCLSLLGILVVLRQIHRSFINLRLKILWLMILSAIALTAAYPAWLDGVLNIVGWEDRLNVALVIAVIFLLAMNFRTSAKVEQLETKLARSVEDLVLRDYEPRVPHDSSNSSGPEQR